MDVCGKSLTVVFLFESLLLYPDALRIDLTNTAVVRMS